MNVDIVMMIFWWIVDVLYYAFEVMHLLHELHFLLKGIHIFNPFLKTHIRLVDSDFNIVSIFSNIFTVIAHKHCEGKKINSKYIEGTH